MKVLHLLGFVLIVAWLGLWLFVKITFVAVHLLLLLGVACIFIALFRSGSAKSAP